MKFHVLGVPHSITSKNYNFCAFTQKVYKFCKMMTRRGHTIIHYGHKDSDPECFEHVSVTTNEDLLKTYGDFDFYNTILKTNPSDYVYKIFYSNVKKELHTRISKDDFILAFYGLGHKQVCDYFDKNKYFIVEPGIGYNKTFAPFRVFESYALYHATIGPTEISQYNANLPNWYDVVIPNYFDLDDFHFQENKEEYFLYLGRIIGLKGIDIAIDVTTHLGKKLIIAGQDLPNLENRDDLFSNYIQNLPKNVEFFGYADNNARKKLMSNAKAGFVPTRYVEPFGGVQIEMLLSGTPTITTDWGAFSENNLHGITGYRCRTFEQFISAAKNINNISPLNCRKWAENFSLENVGPMYEEYFNIISDYKKTNSWYSLSRKGNLNWLYKKYG